MLRKLTPKETWTLELIWEGLTASEIATRMGIARDTVKWYRKRVMVKLGARNVVQIVRTAIEKGLIIPGKEKPHDGLDQRP